MNESVVFVSGTILELGRANTIMQSIAEERSKSILSRYAADYFSIDGDAFQVLMKDSQDAIRMVLEMRAMLKQLIHSHHPKGMDARSSVGLSTIDDGAIEAPQHSAAGVRSISGLDELNFRNGRLGVSTGNYENDALIGATMRLLDRVVANWSSSQASAMEYALQGLTQHQIADILNITQPSVNNRLKLAHWNEIEHINEVWESFVMQKSDMEYIY